MASMILILAFFKKKMALGRSKKVGLGVHTFMREQRAREPNSKSFTTFSMLETLSCDFESLFSSKTEKRVPFLKMQGPICKNVLVVEQKEHSVCRCNYANFFAFTHVASY